MQANSYMHRTGTRPEHLAMVSVKNHGNAFHNPMAQLPMKITIDDVLQSEMVADPLHKLDCSPVSDGCCAVILASESRAQKYGGRPVWVKGVSFCSDSYFLGDRDLAIPRSLKAAGQKAYSMAGITEPSREIHVAEVYDAFSYQELMWIEGLGLCEEGRSKDLMEKDAFHLKGTLPVNPSGGLLSGHPVIAGGLIRIAEAVRQLRGEAGDYQVDGATRAMAHGINGLCGQSHCVWILDSAK